MSKKSFKKNTQFILPTIQTDFEAEKMIIFKGKKK